MGEAAEQSLDDNRSVDLEFGPTEDSEHAPSCPYCDSFVDLVDSQRVHQTSHGLIWLCRGCGAYVGCHKGTSRPKGTLANAELRMARIQAHAAFDPFWKKDGRNRSLMYRWLAAALLIPTCDCHIGMFNLELCRRAVEVCRLARERENKSNAPV